MAQTIGAQFSSFKAADWTGAGASAVSSIFGALSNYYVTKAQEKVNSIALSTQAAVSLHNAKLVKQQQASIDRQVSSAIENVNVQASQLRSSGRAAVAASNAVVDYGSAANWDLSVAVSRDMDVQQIEENAARAKYELELTRSSLLAESAIASMGTAFDAGRFGRLSAVQAIGTSGASFFDTLSRSNERRRRSTAFETQTVQ